MMSSRLRVVVMMKCLLGYEASEAEAKTKVSGSEICRVIQNTKAEPPRKQTIIPVTCQTQKTPKCRDNNNPSS